MRNVQSVPTAALLQTVSCENANLYHAISKIYFAVCGWKLFTFHAAVNNAESNGAYQFGL